MKDKEKTVMIAGRVYAPDFCDHMYYTAEVSAALAKRIVLLQRMVIALGVYSITEFDFTCKSWDAIPLPRHRFDILTDNCLELPLRANNKKEPLRCDVMELIVTDTDFKWTWQPKHCDTICPCSSDQIDIAELMKNLDIKEKGTPK